MRAQYPNGHFRLNPLLAKARVAPLHQLSIPCLEIQGVVLGVLRCYAAIKELGPIATQIIYWCDWWFSNHTSMDPLSIMQISRVRLTPDSKILNSSSAIKWRHIPGELNIAYDCSLGIPANHLSTKHRWFHGPVFLTLLYSSWSSTSAIVMAIPMCHRQYGWAIFKWQGTTLFLTLSQRHQI